MFVAQNGTGYCGDVVYFTDDGGINWNRSSTIIGEGNEAQIVELANGTLLLNARLGLEKGHDYDRQFSTSEDGGQTWSSPVRRSDLAAASCMGSFLATSNGHGKQVLLYSHPGSFIGRTNGTVWLSADEAKTFTPMLHVSPANASTPFAYSCMSPTHAEGVIGLAYETEAEAEGCHGPSCRIAFTTFALREGP